MTIKSNTTLISFYIPPSDPVCQRCPDCTSVKQPGGGGGGDHTVKQGGDERYHGGSVMQTMQEHYYQSRETALHVCSKFALTFVHVY